MSCSCQECDDSLESAAAVLEALNYHNLAERLRACLYEHQETT